MYVDWGVASVDDVGGSTERSLCITLQIRVTTNDIHNRTHTLRSHIQVPLRLVTAIPDAFKGEGMG